MSKLYEDVITEYGKKPLRDMEIPTHIKENISKELRPYQAEAIKNYLANNETLKKNHLMFNMATGSGKTLVMAALMLDCYKKGYRNFIFFVNSTSIVEKTKANFCDSGSSKYLFKNIKIDGKRVEVNAINNFNESKENAINIYFSTIQGLFLLFKEEKENSLTLEDLQNYEIVFLADEAHHLNSETKKTLTQSEKDDKEGWESIINKAFKSHDNNLMLEFTATIPKEKQVIQKYENKLIYEYALKEFCENGYSKKIFLVKYDNDSIKSRFIGTCVLSVYRQMVAQTHKIELKPVVLFKSESIKQSYENQEYFNDFLDELNADDIKEFYASVKTGKDEDDLFVHSRNFFFESLGNNFEIILASHIKSSFKSVYQLNANDEKEAMNNQMVLNTLEDKENEIRVIFAVDKLNEGWDVLNLFDIVRLGSAVAKNTAKTTTKEAQLIGRGARYYPFIDPYKNDKSKKYSRKYDDREVPNKDYLYGFFDLCMLERLSYHALNDVEYINNLRESMREIGIEESKEIKIELQLTKKAEEISKNNKIYYVKNEKLQKSEIFISSNAVKNNIKNLRVPYISSNISDIEENFKDEINVEKIKNDSITHTLNDVLEYRIFAKAMNIKEISMDDIKKLNDENTFYSSKKDFFEKFFAPLKIDFNKKQEFGTNEQLEIAKYLLDNFAKFKEMNAIEYEVTGFKAYELKNTGTKELVKIISKNAKEKDIIKSHEYEWLYYDKLCNDSDLELEFLRFIGKNKAEIDKKFSEWIIMRNEGFEEFKIYDNRKREKTYGEGFEPDFIFFGKPKDNAKLDHLSAEMIIESKGLHLYISKDKWKEDLILDETILNKKVFETIKDISTKIELNVYALPFFFGKKEAKNKNFEEQFYDFFK